MAIQVTAMPKTLHLARLVFLVCLLTLVSFASALAQTPTLVESSLSMTVEPAFNGYFKYGEWLPLWVEVENNGPDLGASISVPVIGGGGTMVYVAPVELPTLSHKRLLVYILPNNFTRQIEVQLLTATATGEEQLLVSQKVAVQPKPTINYLVGLAGLERGALTLIDAIVIPGAQREKTLVDISLSELPEKYEGLRSFDLLVLNDVDTSTLTPLQLSALETWVRQGGRLVVGGGAGVQRTLSGLSFLTATGASVGQDALLTLAGTQDLSSLEGLAQFANPERPVRVPGPFITAQVSTQSGQVLATQDDQPLVIEWPFGQGYLDFVALDLSASPFDAWNGTINFWEKLVTPSAVFPEWLPPDISPRQQFASNMPYALTNLPMLDLPSAKGLSLLLGVYILMVGPVNYLVLRRQKRLHWAWLTIPTITLIFSAAAFGLGYLLHGTDVFINKIAVIHLDDSGKGQVTSFVGLFSPARDAYEIQVRGGGLISPLSPYYDPWNSGRLGNPSNPQLPTGRLMTLEQGDPGYVRGLSVEQWSMQSFMDEGLTMDFGLLESDLQIEGDAIVGVIRNQSRYTLKDAAVILGSRFTHLGDLTPGSSADVKLDMADLSSPNFGSPISYALFEGSLNQSSPDINTRQAEVRRQIVENLLERTPLYISARSKSVPGPSGLGQTLLLLGWLDEAPPDVRISGSIPGQQTTAVALMPLTYSLPESGPISLPAGLIPGKLTISPRDGGSCGMTGSTAVYIVNGEAQFEFALPTVLQNATMDNLKLTLWTDGAWFSGPEASLYNWQVGDWVPLEGMNQGTNLIPNPAPFISATGLVRVRLAEQNGQSCYYLGLGLEAH
jgi:hypothetical protein